VSQVLQSLRPPGRRPPLRRLVILLVAWVALAGGALLVAKALDQPSGESARDEAQAAAPGPIATTTSGSSGSGAASLPPFAMVLDHRLPAAISNLPPATQAQRLRLLAMRTKDPERFVELGSVLQVIGDLPSADFSYRSALKLDPGRLDAQVGVALVPGGSGASGLAEADRRLAALAAAHPDAQIVRFNQAWVAIYRGRPAAARAQLQRTVALGPGTRLGRTSSALIAALEKIQVGRTP
jgi:hypothetical protein